MLGFLGVVLVCFAVKAAVIGRFGTDLLFWDQWSKEGEYMLVPWFERGEFWSQVFVPHNEHRIAPTLALNLGWVVWSGQWDARVQCVGNALLHAVITAVWVAWGVRQGGRGVVGASLITVAVGALPIAWDNVIGGFQSVYYFLVGFSLLAIAGLLGSTFRSLRWWLAWLSGALALISMGSGLLVGVPVLAVALVRVWRNEGERGAQGATLAAAAMLVGLGCWLHTATPWHAPLHARNGVELMAFFTRCLAWPWMERPWFAAVVWLPWCLILVRRWRTRDDAGPDDFIVAAGFWVMLQAAAVGYARAGSWVVPATRYGDVFGVGVVLGAFSWVRWLHRSDSLWARIGATLWALTVSVALIGTTVQILSHDLPERKGTMTAAEESVREFVQTDDFASFEKRPRPFPLADWLARLLRQPTLRGLLPSSVRGPLLGPGRVTLQPPHNPPEELPGAFRWRSEVLPVHDGYWRWQVTRPTSTTEATLSVRGESGALYFSKVLPIELSPVQTPEPTFELICRAPPEPARLELIGRLTQGTLELVTPRAMSPLSRLAAGLCTWAWVIGGVGVGLWTVSAVWRARDLRTGAFPENL